MLTWYFFVDKKIRQNALNITEYESRRLFKRDTNTGRFIDQKSDKEPFKGVRKEK